ncbi:uncharacterized protein LOC123531928 [Mercenaria mercenaria]|uniref:uncharacterized protein LOC123531928 n=1 Tax=Mercenaria mercenaria TaxID=6596 RepID=UPI00234E67E4|nr:uncharacterized protein LOC123531928 [Mercenaria mercenaria]
MSTTSQKKAQATKPQQCRRHNGEPITVFSDKFEKCMCLKCAMEQHDLLSDFMPISEGVERMKSVGKVLQDEISLMVETTKTLKRDRTKFMEKIHSSEKNIRGQIRKVRDKLNRHLDLIEQKLTNKLKQIVEKSERAFSKDQLDIQHIESDLQKMKDNLKVCLKTGGDTALISGVVAEKTAFQNKKSEVIAQQEKLPTKTLQFRISNSILDFTENVQDFGEVSLQMPFDEYDESTDSSPLPLTHRSQANSYHGAITPLSFTQHDSPRSLVQRYPGNRVKNKYGIHVSNPYHPFNAQFNKKSNGVVSYRNEYGDEFANADGDFEGVRDDPIILSSDHEGPCYLSGVAALTSGRVVVCDSKHKCVQLINRRSEVLDQLVFHYKPCDVAAVSENSVVVSFIEKDFISVYTASHRALSHKRDVGVSGRGGSYSIAFSKNKFAVCRRGEIRIVSSVDGSLISRLQIEAHFPQIAMSDGGSKIYLSDFVGGKVSCMNELGKTKWEYSHDELEPYSLAVDLNQLFIADIKGKILIMSTYGILVRELQCYGRLHAVCVDPNTGTLLVTQENNKDKVKSRSIKIVTI